MNSFTENPYAPSFKQVSSHAKFPTDVCSVHTKQKFEYINVVMHTRQPELSSPYLFINTV